jgi:hypothetical protein
MIRALVWYYLYVRDAREDFRRYEEMLGRDRDAPPPRRQAGERFRYGGVFRTDGEGAIVPFRSNAPAEDR